MMKYNGSSGAIGQYAVAEVAYAPPLNLPENRRVPSGWEAIAVAPSGSGQSTLLKWDVPDRRGEARFRISVGVDVREEKLIEVYLPRSQRVLGVIDIRYPSVFLPYEMIVSAADVEDVKSEGLALRMIKGDDPLWILTGTDDEQTGRTPLFPHLFWSLDPNPNQFEQFFHRMLSMASIQQFGWMEGCVLDGLMDLEKLFGQDVVRPVIEMHLASFFDENNRLRYENPRSEPRDGVLYGSVEATLPFAVMAKVWPDHPAIDVAIDWWVKSIDPRGVIRSNPRRLTAEACYTASYPMAVISKIRGREDLADLAVSQLRVRREKFACDDALYVQTDNEGTPIWRNWARGCAWYVLGFIRTLIELNDIPGRRDLENEFVRVSQWLMSLQQDDGLWTCFVDEPNTGPETSGSAGIAAALALGVEAGLLPASAQIAAQRATEALVSYLTPDGFLTGVSQMNKAGEPLQRSNYRTISQMGMGLMAQLVSRTVESFGRVEVT